MKSNAKVAWSANSLWILALCVSGVASAAQIPQQGLKSPEVGADRKVTFRLRAPNAKTVVLAVGTLKPAPMKQADGGVWTFTTDALEPDYYIYSFYVDGQGIPDPANPSLHPKVMGAPQSMFRVPGDKSLPWEPNDVPHGVLHRHVYSSKTAGEMREFLVYTPPGYDPSANTTFPVMYLLHGVMDDQRAWTTAGRADAILDNLIAQGKAKPMVAVFPLGYGFANAAEKVFDIFRPGADQRKMMDDFAATILDEILPQVEKTYKVSKERVNRAIAGLSMGGAQATYVGLNHPETFAWVGAFSSAFIMYGSDREKFFPGVGNSSKQKQNLVWIACGKEDFLYGSNGQFKDWLKAKKTAFTPIETSGGHTWSVWHRNLAEFVPLLFR